MEVDDDNTMRFSDAGVNVNHTASSSTRSSHTSRSSSKRSTVDEDITIKSSYENVTSSSARLQQKSRNSIKHKTAYDDGKNGDSDLPSTSKSSNKTKPKKSQRQISLDLSSIDLLKRLEDAKARFPGVSCAVQLHLESNDHSALNEFAKFFEVGSAYSTSINPVTNGHAGSAPSSSDQQSPLQNSNDDTQTTKASLEGNKQNVIKKKAHKDEAMVDYHIYSYMQEFHKTSFKALR